MSSHFADAARRMSGQFADAARELSWRARYTRTPGGIWTRCRWRVGWDNVVHPQRMAELRAEDRMWNGSLGESLAELEELRRAQEEAEWERLHGLTPYLTGPTPWEHAQPPEVDLGPAPVAEHDADREAGQ